MRSSDFLLQLKKALENELSAAQVQDNVERELCLAVLACETISKRK